MVGYKSIKKKIEINKKNISYCEEGSGVPILFLHGNPTYSYLWRNIIPNVSGFGKCIAPDLIGMGESDKLDNVSPNSYSFVEHRKWLDLFIKRVINTEKMILVVHDWGSALGFDWCFRNKNKIIGIAYMEAIVRPLTWNEFPKNAKKIFKALRSDAGEEMILDKNVFIEKILPASIIRKLNDKEMQSYRKPFIKKGEDRRPTLTWPRQIPLNRFPEDVFKIVLDYSNWMSESTFPKLFINAEPGSILTGSQREFCRKWNNQQEVVVPGIHFIQEDSPNEISAALIKWIKDIY